MSTASPSLVSRTARISYWFVFVLFVLVGWLKLGAVLLATFFCFLALEKIHFVRSKWATVGIFTVVLAGLAYALAHFVNQAVVALPKIAHTAVPSVIGWAETRAIELPFTDYASLKELLIDSAKTQAHYLGNFANFAKGATTKFVMLIIGAVVAASLFLNAQMDLEERHAVKHNLYSLVCAELAERFRRLYHSFATVMGAQLLISTINTVLTTIFIVAVNLPYAPVVIGVTFFCGLLPVIGNLVSNTVIVGIGFTISPQMALTALVFLVVIHKLEYFLNSKIIGDRIKNPVWLTLLALIVGERLLGIPGMVLAPVLLHYVKSEAARIELPAAPGSAGSEAPAENASPS